MKGGTLATLAATTALMVALLWVAPRSEAHRTAVGTVGTAGHQTAEPEDSPATLHDLETVTGAVDPHALIGSPVDFSLKAGAAEDDHSFWVGPGDNRLLVVSRTAVPAGQPVRIIGMIEGRAQGVFIRAANVIPED